MHTHSSEHTPRAVGSHLCCGFGALLKGLTSVVVLKVEESAVHSLPPPTIPARPETRTRNLWITSPTLYLLGHDCSPQCGDFIKELSFGFKSALTMRPDKVACMLSSMADAGSVGLDSMPPVETVVASLAVQADEALRFEPHCPQPEYKQTDTLVHKTYSVVANVGCISNTLAQLLLALNASLPSLDNSGCAEILQASLQAVGAAASECGRSLGLLTQLRKQVWPLPESGKNILHQLPLVPGQVFGAQAQ